MRTAWLALACCVLGCGRLAPDQDVGDASTADAGVVDAAADADAPMWGSVSVNEDQSGNFIQGEGVTSYTVGASAVFLSKFGVEPDGGDCMPTAFGSQCFLATCAGAATLVGAGTLTLAGGPFGQGVSIPEPDAGLYSYDLKEKQLMPSGEVLSVAATGDQIPPFTAQVSAPANITLLTPQGPYAFTSGQDATFTWSGGASGTTVAITMIAPAAQAFCLFDAAAGTGTFPHAMFAWTSGKGALNVTVVRQTNVSAGGDPIAFRMERSTTSDATFQ